MHFAADKGYAELCRLLLQHGALVNAQDQEQQTPLMYAILCEYSEVVEVLLTHGADKYGKENWKELDDFENRYYAALMRHIVEWRKGNKIDSDSGLPHLSHAMCNLVFLCWKEKQK